MIIEQNMEEKKPVNVAAKQTPLRGAIFDCNAYDDTIHIWANREEDSQPFLLIIENYQPTFYVMMQGTKVINKECDIPPMVDYYEKKMSGMLAKPIEYKYAETLYGGWPRPKRHMFKLTFDNDKSMYNSKRFFRYAFNIRDTGNSAKFQILEDKIDKVTKLCTERKIDKAGDIEVSKYTEVKGVAKCPAYRVSYKDISPTTLTKRINISKLSIDIETYSSNHKKLPVKEELDCKMFMVSLVHQGRDKKVTKYVVMLGKCDELKGTNLIFCKDEPTLIKEVHRIIDETDPDIITGYNILGYDFEYIETRRMVYDLPEFNTTRLLITPDDKPAVNRYTVVEWKSGAYGNNSIKNIAMYGRLSYDMLMFVKRNYKLRKYTLDVVCQHFLKKTKYPLKIKDMFIAYENYAKWVGLDGKEGLKIKELRKLKEQKDTLPLVQIEKINNLEKEIAEIIDAYRNIVKYNDEDSVLVNELFNFFECWIQTTEMSKVVFVTPYEVETSGQQKRVLNQIYRKTYWRGIIIDATLEERGYVEGGSVVEPVRGLSKNVMVVDFGGLYPSIIRLLNADYTTLVSPDNKDIDDKDCSKTVTYDDEGKVVAEDRFYLHYKGILPEMCEELTTQRDAVKKQMKALAKDDPLRKVLDAKQLALKVSNNSIYGFTGVKNGKLPIVQVFRAITAQGRQKREEVTVYIVKKYKVISIYGDTDSAMVKVPLWDEEKKRDRTPKEMVDLAYKICDDINSILPKPLYVELEKICIIYCLEKKKYAYIPYNKDGTITITMENIIKKGIMTARRDGCLFIYGIFDNVLLKLFQEVDFFAIVRYIYKNMRYLLNEGDKIPLANLSIVTKYSGQYKDKTKNGGESSYYMKTFGERLVRDGRPPAADERLEYIIAESEHKDGKDEKGKKVKKGEMMYLVEEVNEAKGTNKEIKINYMYYVTNLMANQIDKLVHTQYGNDENLQQVSYRKNGRCNPKDITEPINFYLKMLQGGADADGMANDI